MPTATKCNYKGEEITVEKALEIRGDRRLAKGIFECTECSLPVKPHKGSDHASAHFEHYLKNPNCPLSNSFNKESYVLSEFYDIEDPKAIEGYETDRKILVWKRNASLAKKCKQRDNFTCRACGFKLKLKGRHIVECHHTVMVSEGEREVSLNELITLCPTCHRIAHTRSEPYSLDELREIVGKH